MTDIECALVALWDRDHPHGRSPEDEAVVRARLPRCVLAVLERSER